MKWILNKRQLDCSVWNASVPNLSSFPNNQGINIWVFFSSVFHAYLLLIDHLLTDFFFFILGAYPVVLLALGSGSTIDSAWVLSTSKVKIIFLQTIGLISRDRRFGGVGITNCTFTGNNFLLCQFQFYFYLAKTQLMYLVLWWGRVESENFWHC